MVETNFLIDELVNKIYHLTKDLDKASIVIQDLKKENIELKEIIYNLKK